MNFYTPAGWENFFMAVAGAAAALGGLLFVALSINLARILASAGLAIRAAEVIVVLAGNLFVSLFVLIPAQGPAHLADELIGVGVLMWLFSVRAHYRSAHLHTFPNVRLLCAQILFSQSATLPVIVAGISIHLQHGYGLYWLVPAVFFSFTHALINAWVLLVEILR